MTDFSHSGWRALRWLAAGSLLLVPLALWGQTVAEPVLEAAPAPAVAATPPQSAPGACAEFVRWLPNVSAVRCRDAGLQPSAGRSVQGRTIFVRDIAVPQPRLKVLVVGAIHGDEMSSASMVLHWIGLARADAAGVSWRFIPALNPDGLFKRPAQRVNAHGIDLNRNFPTPDWARQARSYWEQRTQRDPRRFPGSTPLSEPESRFLHSEMDAFKPNLIISVHAPYGVLDFDGPSVEPPRRLGSLHLDQVGIYPGSLGNYAGVHRGMPVVTIELPSSEATPRDAEMQHMWADLLLWMGERLAAPVRAVPVRPPPAPPPAPPAPASAPEPEPSPEPPPAPLPLPAEAPASAPEPALPAASAPETPPEPAEPAASAASTPQ